MSYFSNKNKRFINSFEISILSSFGFPRATSGFIWDLFGPPLVSTWTSWTPFGAPLGSLVGVMAPSGHPLGVIFVYLGRLGALLEASKGHIDAPEAWMDICVARGGQKLFLAAQNGYLRAHLYPKSILSDPF